MSFSDVSMHAVRREQGGFLPDAERRRGGLCRDRLAPSRDRTPDKSPAPAHEGEQQPSEPRQEQRKGRDANSKEQRDGNTAAQKSRVQSGNAGSREAVGQVRGSDRASTYNPCHLTNSVFCRGTMNCVVKIHQNCGSLQMGIQFVNIRNES